MEMAAMHSDHTEKIAFRNSKLRTALQSPLGEAISNGFDPFSRGTREPSSSRWMDDTLGPVNYVVSPLI